MPPVLQVRNLKTHFHTDAGVARAVDDVSFDLEPGKTMALVGESGCGKSVTALSVLRLIPDPPGEIVGGEILLRGDNLLDKPMADMRRIRGNTVSMIFQEPMTSLNPVFRVGGQIVSALRLHRDITKEEAREQAIDLLRRVGIPSPDERIDDYPHQMSGGMRQRAMIAMALACEPSVLIADEPTTALDVTIQAQILDLLQKLQRDQGMAILLITHDLGVVAEVADDVRVMYAGKIVERGNVREVFNNPRHPYTVGLFDSLPGRHLEGGELYAIPGTVPASTHFPAGCRFNPRCPHSMDVCRTTVPPEFSHPSGVHPAACWLHDEATMREQGRPTGLPQEARQ